MSQYDGDEGYIHALTNFFKYQPDPCGIKNTQSVFIYANDPFCNLVGMRKIEGLQDSDMECGASNFAKHFQEQDRLVECSRDKHVILDVHPYAKGWQAYITTKTPLILPSGKIAGTIFQQQNLENRAGRVDQALVNLLTPTKNLDFDDYMNVQLTEREELILFFLLRGRTAKNIAVTLNRSYRTIEHTLDRIRNKFDAISKSDLISLAVSKGYYKMIPQALFHTQASILLT